MGVPLRAVLLWSAKTLRIPRLHGDGERERGREKGRGREGTGERETDRERGTEGENGRGVERVGEVDVARAKARKGVTQKTLRSRPAEAPIDCAIQALARDEATAPPGYTEHPDDLNQPMMRVSSFLKFAFIHNDACILICLARSQNICCLLGSRVSKKAAHHSLVPGIAPWRLAAPWCYGYPPHN